MKVCDNVHRKKPLKKKKSCFYYPNKALDIRQFKSTTCSANVPFIHKPCTYKYHSKTTYYVGMADA